MKTSLEWWTEVKADESKFNEWLKKQYHGELTAAERIEALDRTTINIHIADAFTLGIIAHQERKHAGWVGDLLKARGITPERIENKVTPYWDATLGKIENFADATAVAALAEKMRLERIKVIADDLTAPSDVREVFGKILTEELFHERAFRKMSNPEAIQKALEGHEAGLDALGLIMVQEVL